MMSRILNVGKVADLLDYIRQYIGANGYPPTIREMAAGCDISSTSVVNNYLVILEKEGKISRDRGRARGLRLSDD
jgi:repressor LexA